MNMGCAAPVKGFKQHTGGFKANREFGFALADMFPTLDLSEVDTEGAALVVEIPNPRALHLHKLSRFVIGAAKGGVKTAVVSIPSRGLLAAMPIFNLFAVVEQNAELKDMKRLERAMRQGG
jgi:hypothetical protein